MRFTPINILFFCLFAIGIGASSGAVLRADLNAKSLHVELDSGSSLYKDPCCFFEIDEKDPSDGKASAGRVKLSPTLWDLGLASRPAYTNTWHLFKVALSLCILYCSLLN